MPEVTVGDQVAALLSADEHEIKFLGYGTYQGGHPSQIDLNSGRTIYGNTCWWMGAERFDEFKGDRELVYVYPEGDKVPDKKKGV